jgi:hypothetical protein
MLTKEELNKKYPIYRDEMTQEQERKFVNDVFEVYENEDFAKVLGVWVGILRNTITNLLK